MAWQIECSDAECGEETRAANIDDLISRHRDDQGYFLCKCGKRGFIRKNYHLQENRAWEPILRGAIYLRKAEDTYHPFVFLVSYGHDPNIKDIWFSYYKDLRHRGGRLKLGHGPGGPPLLWKDAFLQLLADLKEIGFISADEIKNVIKC